MNVKPKNQKFRHGDLVRVADDLGSSMAHFTKSCNAIVMASYYEQFGGSSTKDFDYTIFIEGGGETSWYHEHQLTFIRHAPELLETWNERKEAFARDRSSMKWIRDNWSIVEKEQTAASILAIFKALGFHSSFEHNGEYFCLYSDWDSALPFVSIAMKSKSEDDMLTGLRRMKGVEIKNPELAIRLYRDLKNAE